jgi:MarR family transcriptional regulator, transcriptional regulator for hemolysin
VEPIGREVGFAAKALARAFGAALAEAGGSVPMWSILLALDQGGWRTQQQLARAVGIEGATLTRHLDGLEAQGLVFRARSSQDRRSVRVELTPSGERKFVELRAIAVAFDRRLREGIAEDELDQLRDLLRRLVANVSDPDAADPPEPRVSPGIT